MIKIPDNLELEKDINAEIDTLKEEIKSLQTLKKVTSAETRPQKQPEGQLKLHQEGEAVQLAVRLNGRNYTVNLTAE